MDQDPGSELKGALSESLFIQSKVTVCGKDTQRASLSPEATRLESGNAQVEETKHFCLLASEHQS
jgi:hypothetical protein